MATAVIWSPNLHNVVKKLKRHQEITTSTLELKSISSSEQKAVLGVFIEKSDSEVKPMSEWW